MLPIKIFPRVIICRLVTGSGGKNERESAREHGAERHISPEDTDVALMGLPGGLANLAVPSRSTLAVHLELAVESTQIDRLAVFQLE